MKLRFLLGSAGITAVIVAGAAPAFAADGGMDVAGSTFAASSAEQRSFNSAYSFMPVADGMNGAYGYSSAANAVVGATYDALSKGYLYSGLAAAPHYLKVASIGWFESGAGSSQYAADKQPSALAPQDYAMALAGLGIVGTVIRRRSHGF